MSEIYCAFDLDESIVSQRDCLKPKHHRALTANMFSRREISIRLVPCVLGII